MKRGVFICVLTLAVMLMPALVLAEGPGDLGYLVIDQEDMQTYLIYEDWESIEHAMGEEEITNAVVVKAKPMVFQTWTNNNTGNPDSWFSVPGGETPTFVVTYDIITGGVFTITLKLRGPDRYRETVVYDMDLPTASVTSYIFHTVPNIPGYYKYTIKLKGKGGGVLKGSYRVVP